MANQASLAFHNLIFRAAFALKSSSVSLPPSEVWDSHWKRREELNMGRKEQSDGQVLTHMLILINKVVLLIECNGRCSISIE